ncbi:TIGR01440 family protein [Paenibacillus sp. BC26]|uniref:TIGR01440 family protein n=1 Tax=Paenibacillus sp. BC26 TaxID=1881032 RepID=UPI0008DF509E|nr:TIGR01440 family protein [Paenibacillus sp. BC26]SFT25212.1 TIGR01440 family protein [Paenibacillus sp. BC26]
MSDHGHGISSMDSAQLTKDVETVVRELAAVSGIRQGQLLVIGVSTSEVLGQRIGTSGTLETAAAIYAGVEKVRQELQFYPVYQCCEHLNRALVMEREAAERYGLELVSAIPVRKAGGSMAAYAFQKLQDAVLTETVQAHAGIDIGDTFIGMHLKRVAVPVRPTIRAIGSAHLTMAYTRPKLIGGERAVYTREAAGPATDAGTCD